MSEIHGYISIKADIAAELCKKYLAYREVKRNEAREEFIKKEMSRRFFPAKTREAAIKRERDEFGFLKWGVSGGYWEMQVESLKVAAESGLNNYVLVSQDVYECLASFNSSGSHR